IGVGIGDQVLDLRALAEAGLLPSSVNQAVSGSTLNPLMSLELPVRRELRSALSRLVTDASSPVAVNTELRGRCLFAQREVTLEMPAAIGDYTDFYASVFHATNVGSMFRPDNPLLPNYKHIPIGYHGRASSIVPSGTPVRRPSGQLPPAVEGQAPTFG
ncbi:MAG: fumarylacetoacetase, partial [Planctomycetota bacterium]